MRKLLSCLSLIALPLLAEDRPYEVNAAFLYWWTNAPGLTYALRDTNPTLTSGKYLAPNMKPEVGFKVGAGYLLPHDGWDLFLQLTHLHSRAPIHQTAHGDKVFYPSWITAANVTNGYVNSIGGHWRLHLGFLDLELGKMLSCSHCLDLRPFIGLRYAVVRQKYKLRYMGGTLFPDDKDCVYMTSKDIAAGLRSGFDLDWNISKGFGIYSELAFSLLYGSIRVHGEEKVASETEKRYEVEETFPAGTGVIDIALGLEWQKIYRPSCYRLALQLGWEEHLFLEQNNFFRFVPPSYSNPFFSRESLDVEGIVLNGIFHF